MSAGAVLMRNRGPWRDIGIQWLIWGAIDAVLAVFGVRGAQQKLQNLDTLPAGQAERDTRNLQRIFAINAVLDIGYLAAGGWLFRSRRFHGHGAGVLVQALFLLIFDVLHAIRLARRG